MVRLARLSAALYLFASTGLAAAAPPPMSAGEVNDLVSRNAEIDTNLEAILGKDFITDAEASEARSTESYGEVANAILKDSQDRYTDAVSLARELAGSQMAAGESQGWVPQQDAPGAAGEVALRYKVFISQKMPLNEIRALSDMLRGREDSAIVVRGLLPGQTMADLQRWLFTVNPINDDMATFQLDPVAFTELGVDRVPVTARYGEDEKLLAFVAGTTSPGYLEDAVDSGKRGNLGTIGPTIAVDEEDMLAMIKRRAEQFDWQGSAKGAQDRFWKRQLSHDLPRVQFERTRLLDPTFVVSQTITAPDGTVIAMQGQRVNPLEAIPFTRIIAVFDAGDVDQLAWMRQVIAQHGANVIAMVAKPSALPRLSDLGELSDELGAALYPLSTEMMERFHIEAVPTLVRARGLAFELREEDPRGTRKEDD